METKRRMTVMTPEAKSLRINVLRRQRSAIDAEIVRLGGTLVGNPMWECHRCGHQWASVTALPPKQCPAKGCRSPYWDRPKEQTRADRAMGQETEVPRVPMTYDRAVKAAEKNMKTATKVIEKHLDDVMLNSPTFLPPDLPPPPPPVTLSSQLAELRLERPNRQAHIADGSIAVADETIDPDDGLVDNPPATGPEIPLYHHDDDAEPDANDTADEADADGRTH